MTRKFRISRKKRKLIEAAVEEAEKHTSGEIVPIIVRASHDYWWVHWYWAALCVIPISTALWWAASDAEWARSTHEWLRSSTDFSFWGVGAHEVMKIQFCAGIFGFALAFLEPFKRFVIPRKWAATQVHRQCLANFIAAGLTETRDRTGVLIYISHLERRVEILADKGINDATPKDFWDEQTKTIIQGIHRRKAAEALVYVIQQTGKKLAEKFPPRHDDTNEISNHLRLGHQSLSEMSEEPTAVTPSIKRDSTRNEETFAGISEDTNSSTLEIPHIDTSMDPPKRPVEDETNTDVALQPDSDKESKDE